MKLKFKLKLIADACMTALLPLLMAYSLIGESLHEWIGVGMLALAVAHNLLNASWHRNLLRGEYTLSRIFQMILNILSIFCVVGLAVSGVMLSRYVFVFVPQSGGSEFARALHMLCSYWGFVLISIHLGMHIGMITALVQKAFGGISSSKYQVTLLRIASTGVCAYGVFAFIKRDIASYLFLKTHFAFFDFSEPLIFFLVDYVAIMGMFAVGGCMMNKMLQETRKSVLYKSHILITFPRFGTIAKNHTPLRILDCNYWGL